MDEPLLLLDKSAVSDTNWMYGDTVTYTLGLTSDPASAASAFNLRVVDRIPDGLNVTGFTSTPANWVATSSGTNSENLVWTCDNACSLPVGGLAAFEYIATVDLPTNILHLNGDDLAVNNATLTWTSLPGTGTTPNDTGSTVPGASGDANGERTGSGVTINDYTNSATHTGSLTNYYSIGNRVWFDTDNSGTMNGTEVGVDEILVQLFAASDTNFATVLASDPTASGGYYLFDYLEPGEYVVVIPVSNFTGAGRLVGYWSSNTLMDDFGDISETVLDVDGAPTDADDNGKRNTIDPLIGAVVTQPITLGGVEPIGEVATQLKSGVLGNQGAQPDARANMTVDFGFYKTEIGGLLWMEGGTVVDGKYVLADDSLMSDNTVRLYAADGITEIPVGLDGILGTVGDGPGGMLPELAGITDYSGLPPGNYVVKVSETIGMISTLDTLIKPIMMIPILILILMTMVIITRNWPVWLHPTP